MNNNLKALYLAFMITVLFVTTYSKSSMATEDDAPTNPQLEVIKESQEKKPVMQTRKWNPPTYNKNNEDSADKKETESDENKTKDSDDTELTTEQTIWNKYKKIADEGAKKNKDQSSSKDDEVASNDENTTDEDADANNKNADEQAEEEKEATGLAAILQRYKKTQKSKRNMQTRSLGSID